jgi:hypothetical protein
MSYDAVPNPSSISDAFSFFFRLSHLIISVYLIPFSPLFCTSLPPHNCRSHATCFYTRAPRAWRGPTGNGQRETAASLGRVEARTLHAREKKAQYWGLPCCHQSSGVIAVVIPILRQNERGGKKQRVSFGTRQCHRI